MSRKRLPLLPFPARTVLNRAVSDKIDWTPPDRVMARWDRRANAKTKPAAEQIEVLDVIGNFGDFGGVSAEKISAALKAAKGKPVNVVVNSPGGDMFEGVAIYNLLRSHPADVTVRVVGMAASAASVIAMAGDRIEIDESAFMMIHNAWGMAIGDTNELKEFAALLARYDEDIANVYASRTGRDPGDVAKMMKKETWMNAEEALSERFADAVIPNDGGGSAKASASLRPQASASALAASGHLRAGAAFALGSQQPGVSGHQRKGKEDMKTIKEQIASFEAKRAASAARMEEIMNAAAAEGRSLEDNESEEYENLKSEVAAVDKHLVRLREHERIMASSATPAAGGDPDDASASRGGVAVRAAADAGGGVISVKSNLPKGTGFTRYVIALARARGNKFEAAQFAKKRWEKDTPEVHKALMAAVDAGSTTDSTWAGPLVVVDNLAAEFIDLLRPATIIGRIQGFRRVPFNVKMPRKTTGSTVGWVGQGAPKPVSELAFDSITLGFAKTSGIVVLTEELVRFSSPSAEALVRADLIEAISEFQDQQFIDPAVAALANVNPASVTNGVTPVTSTGSTIAAIDADVRSVFQLFIDSNIPLNQGIWVMNPRTALYLSMLRTTQDIKAYPDITPQGGTFWGLPVITSNNVPIDTGTSGDPTIIVLLAPQEILLADDGGVSIDVSREASLQMDTAPSSGEQAVVSLWQNNLVGLRAERFINYLKRRSAAVQYIETVTY